MGFNRKELKRLKFARKTLGRQQQQLRQVQLEGVLRLTLHTAMHSLTLAGCEEAASAAIMAYYEWLHQEREHLREQVAATRKELAWEREVKQQDNAFLSAAKNAAQHGRLAVKYPL